TSCARQKASATEKIAAAPMARGSWSLQKRCQRGAHVQAGGALPIWTGALAAWPLRNSSVMRDQYQPMAAHSRTASGVGSPPSLGELVAMTISRAWSVWAISRPPAAMATNGARQAQASRPRSVTAHQACCALTMPHAAMPTDGPAQPLYLFRTWIGNGSS